LSKNEPEEAFVWNAHKTEKNTVWSDLGCYTGLKTAMATQAEGLLDLIMLIQYSSTGFVIPVRHDPNYNILGKSGPLQPAYVHTLS